MGQELYYILEGTFERRKGGRVLGTFEGERSIGESAFLRGVPYEETVIVTRSAEICIFSRKKFDKIVMATEKYFSTVPVLCQLSSSDCKLLLDSTKLVKFAKGEFVIRRGDVANQFYIIIKGMTLSSTTTSTTHNNFSFRASIDFYDIFQELLLLKK